MNDAGWPDRAGKKLRIDTTVRPCVHDDGARRQNSSQQLPLRAIGVRLKSAITEPINGESVFVKLIANSAKKRGR